MALCRDKVLVKRFFHHSPPARSILIPIETRSDRAVPTRDRFSTLPVEIKLNILEHIPFEEAARTSILSRTSNWSEHPQVILDKLLFEERGRWISCLPTAWVTKVAEILNNHPKGPIRKFILHIPDMEFNWDRYINIWIPFLWSNGIKELSVDNWNIITYKLSPFLFECYELTRLKLRNCAFHKSFGSFQNLRFLCLEKIAFGSKIVGAVTLRLSTPSLVRAELVECSGFQHLNIRAPKLEDFVVANNGGMSRDDVNQMGLNLAGPNFNAVCSHLQNYFSGRSVIFLSMKSMSQKVNHLQLRTKTRVVEVRRRRPLSWTPNLE